MIIPIEISDEFLAEQIGQIVRQLFKAGDHYRDGGVGWEALRKVAIEQVKACDFTAVIAGQLAEIVPIVVRSVLDDEIRKQVKVRVAEMKKAGTFLLEVNTDHA